LKYYSEAYDPIVTKILSHYAISFDDLGLYGGMLVAYWAIYNFVALTILLLKRSNWKLWKKIKTKLFSPWQNLCFCGEQLVVSAIPSVARKSSKNLAPQEVEMSASAGLLKHTAGTQSTSGSGGDDENSTTRGLKVEHQDNDLENHNSSFVSSPAKGGGGGGGGGGSGSQRQVMNNNPHTAPEPIGFETYPIPPGHEKYQDVI
jgi:hypothetical protein